MSTSHLRPAHILPPNKNKREKDHGIAFFLLFKRFFSYTPRFPKPGESIRGTSFFQSPGGKGANQAAAAAKLGAAVSFIGMVSVWFTESLFGLNKFKKLSYKSKFFNAFFALLYKLPHSWASVDQTSNFWNM